jgi:hypothetical protein
MEELKGYLVKEDSYHDTLASYYSRGTFTLHWKLDFSNRTTTSAKRTVMGAPGARAPLDGNSDNGSMC